MYRQLPTGRRPLTRLVVTWLTLSATVYVLARALPGLTLHDWRDAFVVGAVLGALNTLLWPLLVRVLLPFAVLTLGLGSLFLSGILTDVLIRSLPGVYVRDAPVALGVSLVVSAISTVVTGLLDVDDDEYFQHRAVRRARRRGGPATTIPGVLFLQIDGLGHDVLRRAIRDGDVPTLARWVRTGTHQLTAWETDWSSQTSASQIALLHGSNDDVPAFRWLEKETGMLMVSNHRADAAEIERRHSDGRGLLHADGASRGNLFTGDAADALLTMSVAARRRGRLGNGYYGYFANFNNLARTLFATIAEIVREVSASLTLRRLDVRPRVARGGLYPFLRAFTTVIIRDVIVSAVLDDIMAGRSVVYADFLGYDEVSHHSGPEHHDTLGVLRGIDRQIGRLERALAVAPRPYRMVVLSDHGQAQGEPFASRYGESLADVVHRACTPSVVPRRPAPRGPAASDASPSRPHSKAAEAWQVDALLADARPRWRRRPRRAVPACRPDRVILASGGLGMIYLTQVPRRLSREEIEAIHPRLIEALRSHPGIGFVLVRSAENGAQALGPRGAHHLAAGRVEGEDPLAPYGPRAAQHVARGDRFVHTADLVVNAVYDETTGELPAFEALLGSHGSLGGQQSRAFVLRPVDAPAPRGPLVGAEKVHLLLRSWLAHYGHEGFAPDIPHASAAPVAQRDASPGWG
jgi:uncharacterized membrane protein YvlD (DUF360 family)